MWIYVCRMSAEGNINSQVDFAREIETNLKTISLDGCFTKLNRNNEMNCSANEMTRHHRYCNSVWLDKRWIGFMKVLWKYWASSSFDITFYSRSCIIILLKKDVETKEPILSAFGLWYLSYSLFKLIINLVLQCNILHQRAHIWYWRVFRTDC